jgi:radical SAM protein with 4Fe4S-binding SPASM domain
LARLLLQGRYDFIYDQMSLSVRAMSARKRANLVRAGLNLVRRRARPWAMPLHMQFELSSLCNLRCLVCPTGRGELGRPGQFMQPELFRRAWNEVAPYLLTASLWGWGESLLHPELASILASAHDSPVVVFLSTNGAHLDRESVVGALLDHPPTYLIVAIDGLSDETHALFRVGSRLAPILDGVERLARLKAERKQRLPILHMRTIALKHNQHELPRAAAFAREHGFDMFSLRLLNTAGTRQAAELHRELLPDAASLRAYADRGNSTAAPADSVCMQPFWFPSIFADGTVVACEQDVRADRPLGRVDERHSFADIWSSQSAASVRSHIRDRSHEIALCRECPLCQTEATQGKGGHALSTHVELFRPDLSPFILEGGNCP